MNNHFIKAKYPTYNSYEKCYCIKDIYKNTEPYDNLFSFHWNNSLFKNKDDAYRELILYVYFEWNYNNYEDIKNISINPVTDKDITNLNKFLEWHLREFGFSWKISEMQILFNMEESKQ
jgi:hypothetical protein